MNVLITNRKRNANVTPPSLRKLAERILRELNRSEAELGLVLMGDRSIRRLNRDYRGKDTPTDVLAFSVDMAGRFRGAGTPPPLLGDVVISVDTAVRQARERGHRPAREIGELLIHGILHLLGYDHEKPGEARKMKAVEKRIRKACLDGSKRR